MDEFALRQSIIYNCLFMSALAILSLDEGFAEYGIKDRAGDLGLAAKGTPR